MAAARHYAGSPLGVTAWIEISQERIDRFAAATGDDGWLYCDPDRAARESPWKTTVAQPFLLISLVPALLPELIVLMGWRTGVNTGVDRFRFPGAVPAGSRVRMHAELSKARPLPGNGCRLVFDVDFEVEGSDEPAGSARVHYIYFP